MFPIPKRNLALTNELMILGNDAGVNLLIKNGANPNTANSDGDTALILAAATGKS